MARVLVNEVNFENIENDLTTLDSDFTAQQPNFNKVGDIIESMLTEAQFQAQRDATWVLMDGRDVTGSDFETITGESTLPDARGQFLRGKNNGRNDGNENPDGEINLGAYQADEFKSHTHGIRYQNAFNGYGARRDPDDDALSSNITQSGDTGGNETRPKNITVNIFIKINN